MVRFVYLNKPSVFQNIHNISRYAEVKHLLAKLGPKDQYRRSYSSTGKFLPTPSFIHTFSYNLKSPNFRVFKKKNFFQAEVQIVHIFGER